MQVRRRTDAAIEWVLRLIESQGHPERAALDSEARQHGQGDENNGRSGVPGSAAPALRTPALPELIWQRHGEKRAVPVHTLNVRTAEAKLLPSLPDRLS